MTAPIIEAAQALVGLLRAADDGGLPMPSNAEATPYTPSPHPGHEDQRRAYSGGISLHLRSLADLTAWATWFDETIDDTTVYRGSTHYRVCGWAGPLPVVAVAVVKQEAVSA